MISIEKVIGLFWIMDNKSALDSLIEKNDDTKIAIGNSLDEHDNLCLYCQFPEKNRLAKS